MSERLAEVRGKVIHEKDVAKEPDREITEGEREEIAEVLEGGRRLRDSYGSKSNT